MARFEFQIVENFHRKRLDEFLFNEFRSMSKAYLRRVVKEGNCEVNGYIENSGKVLKSNDFIEVEVDIDQEKGMKAEDIPLEIVYQDRDILVVDKRAGMLVHPTNYERNGTLLNALTHYLNRGKPAKERFIRPHLIHRLDRETSGLMVVATNPRASKILCSHFKRRLFGKKYRALVEGIVAEDEGTIDAPIDRFEEHKRWNVKPGGKESLTKFRVVMRDKDKTLVELVPVTGRTNQLRIHCSHLGHPILGDEWYGGRNYRRLCLHASELDFRHPGKDKRIKLASIAPFEDEM